jgi:hypothetical protein
MLKLICAYLLMDAVFSLIAYALIVKNRARIREALCRFLLG